MPLNKPISEITEQDFIDLKSNEISEQKELEYKSELKIDTRDDKKEFLEDVSSFANSMGGHLIYGIYAESGIIKDITGLNIENMDSTISDLENLIRDVIKSRLNGYIITPLKLKNGKSLIIIYIPNSWSKPHAVAYNKDWRFSARHSNGKYQLDIYQVKSMFLSSESINKKIKSFRHERISRIMATDTPIKINSTSYIIFHLIPINAFNLISVFDIKFLLEKSILIDPMYSAHDRYSQHGVKYRINIDGILSFIDFKSDKTNSYTQIYRNGIIESVNTDLLNYHPKDNPQIGIPSENLRGELNQLFIKSLKFCGKLELQSPFILMISLIGTRDHIIHTKFTLKDEFTWVPNVFDRDNLLIPEVLIEDSNADVRTSLKIIFDTIWNAAGWEKALE